MEPIILKTAIPAALSKIRPSATFLSVKGYTNNFEELSDFGCVFHIDYIKAVRKAVEKWIAYPAVTSIEKQARLDLISSYTETLRGNRPHDNVYRKITDGTHFIKSVKWHDRGNAVHFYGFEVHKKIHRPGRYPVDTRGEFTIVRDRLMGLTQLSKFRQFKIVEGKFHSITVENLTLTQLDLLRDIS